MFLSIYIRSSSSSSSSTSSFSSSILSSVSTSSRSRSSSSISISISSSSSVQLLQYYKSKIQKYGFPKLTIDCINRLLLQLVVPSSLSSVSSSSVLSTTTTASSNANTHLRTFSCVDLNTYCYTMAHAGDTIWKLYAYESIITKSTILQYAAESDERRRQQRQRGSKRTRSHCGDPIHHQQQQQHDTTNDPIVSLLHRLDGIPLSIKSNIATTTQPYTAGSRILGCGIDSSSSSSSSSSNSSSSSIHDTSNTSTITNYTNIVGYNADITNILQQQCSMILIGTTTMDEFGMGSFGTNSNIQYNNDTSTSTTTTSSHHNNNNNNSHNSNNRTNNTSTTPKNPLPYIYSGNNNNIMYNNNNNNNIVEPWNDTSMIQFMTLPSDAIYEIHDLLLQDYYINYYSKNNNNNIHKGQQQHDCTNDDTTNNDYYYYYSPGGSSCGSAISVSHGSAVISIGTDTGGSIRLPSTYCNVPIGYKPAYGIISRYGLIPYASSFDTIGILGNSTSCIATTYSNIIHHSAYDINLLEDDTSSDKVNDEDVINVHDDDNTITVSPTINNNRVDDTSSSILNRYRRNTEIHDSTQATLSDTYISSIQAMSQQLYDNNTQHDEQQQQCNKLLHGIKIGIPEAFSITECSSMVRQVWEDCANRLQNYGNATIHTVPNTILSADLIQQSLAAYYILVCAEASSNLARYDGLRYGPTVGDGSINDLETDQNDTSDSATSLSILEQQYARTRTELFGPEVIRRILCGTHVLSSTNYDTYYEQATKIRALITYQLTQTLKEYDALLIPTTLYPSPKLYTNRTDLHSRIDPTEMLANDVMTVPISLAGLPAISVSIPGSRWNNGNSNNVHIDDQLPPFQIGMQLVGSRFSDSKLLLAASILETMPSYPRTAI